MNRYYFNIEDGSRLRDARGETLPDADAARRAAIEIMSQILTGHIAHLAPGGQLAIRVLDANHRPIFSIVASTTVH